MTTAGRPAAGKATVLLVDDHPLVRERVAELIALEPDLAVCGQAEDAAGALAAAEALRPDLAVVDVTLKHSYGIELIRELTARQPELRVLVLSMHDESLYAERALRAGARGYLNKQAATAEVVPALRQILAGGLYVSEAVAAALVQKLAASGAAATGKSPLDLLTDREVEVFRLLGQGMAVRDIARNLRVSSKTIESHREHMKRKLSLASSGALLRLAIEYDLRGPVTAGRAESVE